jgi:hypothetical protein
LFFFSVAALYSTITLHAPADPRDDFWSGTRT